MSPGLVINDGSLDLHGSRSVMRWAFSLVVLSIREFVCGALALDDVPADGQAGQRAGFDLDGVDQRVPLVTRLFLSAASLRFASVVGISVLEVATNYGGIGCYLESGFVRGQA